ncbi:leucine-rich PPR motif-containing protein, mitochondrial [Microplitis demolitor]|uniref:leucine-rich PPR motif-containing protein, mitochondrial n=1 Tax=Microplitis demolitor TaxID=69319 RepID=UPI0004400287|nr:leucine-rich PPR motif-containing protein, mitochondrial [Microplitis demolitor]
MTTILRYVRHLRKLNGIGWRVAIHQSNLELTGIKGQVNQLANLSRSYATNPAPKLAATNYNDKGFSNLENQLRKTGRIFYGDVKQLLSDVQTMGTVSGLDALLLIRSCGKPLLDADPKESIQLVQEVWKTLERLKVRMDVSHYNALLNVYLEKDHEFSPAEFLATMTDKSIEPNRVTLQRLIAAYCKQGDITGATKILEQMKAKGLPLSEDIFNSLIVGHSQANDLESAVNTLKMIEAAGISPSADTYTVLMCAYAKRGDMDSINATFDKITKAELTLLENHYLEIIYALAANGHVKQAEEFAAKIPNEVHSDTEISRLLIKLANLNQLELALRLLKSTASDPLRHKIRGSLLTRSLVKSGAPAKDIIRVCEYMTHEISNDRAFSFASYCCLSEKVDSNITLEIFRAWSKSGGTIREHFFWPILMSHGKALNVDGMLDVLRCMMNEFKITPSLETIRDYVVPNMAGKWEYIIDKLSEVNIPRNEILTAIVDRMIVERKLRSAASVINSFPMDYPKDLLISHLVNALNDKIDFKAFIVVLRLLSGSSESSTPDSVKMTVDSCLRELMNNKSSYQASLVANLLNEMVAAGLSASPEVGTEVVNYFGSQVSEPINKLTSGSRTEIPLSEYNLRSYQAFQGNTAVSKQLTELRRSFIEHIENHDSEAIAQTLKQLESAGFLSAPVLAQAISVFCETEDIASAEDCMKKFNENFPDATLDLRKLIKFAELLVKKDRIDEAFKFLSEQRVEEKNEKQSRGVDIAQRSLLDTIAATKNVELTEKMFELLKSKNYIEMDNWSLGPLVKVHLLRDDLPKALETFERACIEHKCTPFKNRLSIAFIEAEDANSLQKLTDLCTEIHGESNALVDLAFAFLDCDKVRQARKIFETPGLQVYNSKISSGIEHFQKYNRPQILEEMVKITKGVERMDRAHMYESLLAAYAKTNDWQRGLFLWTEIQDEDIQPTSKFLETLSKLLKSNNQPIPFAYDDMVGTQKKRTIRLLSTSKPIHIGPFETALKAKDYDEAERLISQESFKRVAVGKYGRLIRSVLDDNQLDKATEMAAKLIGNYAAIPVTVFTELGQKLAEAKRLDDIVKLGNLMDDSMKEKVRYEKILCTAIIEAKGLKEFIKSIKVEDISTDENARNIEKKIHFGSIVHSLIKDPSCLEEFEAWAKKLDKAGVKRGMQVLWNYYYITGNPKADLLWNDYMKSVPSPLIRPVIEYAQKTKDVKLIETLMDKLKKHPTLTINKSGVLMSGVMECYNLLGRYDESLGILHEATKRYRINVIPDKILLDLKQGIERSGRTFPYSFQTQDDEFTEEIDDEPEKVKFGSSKF